MCRKQAEIESARRGISIVACYHSVKLCILGAWAFPSQQSGALTRMWRWCQVQLSQKECAIGAVQCKNEGTLLQLLSWCCVESVIHHKWDVGKEKHTNICSRAKYCLLHLKISIYEYMRTTSWKATKIRTEKASNKKIRSQWSMKNSWTRPNVNPAVNRYSQTNMVPFPSNTGSANTFW